MNIPRFSSPARLSIKEQALFAQRLSFLVKAGIPLLESLTTLRKQLRLPKQRELFDTIISDVARGQFLSVSLGKFERVFGNFAINIIHVGETSGILSENLSYLALELQKKQVLRKKVIGALVYPVFITIATLGITILLTAYIFPKILPIFVSLHVPLPLYTRVLISVSSWVRSYGFIAMIILVVSAFAFANLTRKKPAVRFATHAFLLRLPFIGTVTRGYTITNFCRTLGLLLKSGLPIIEALTVTANTTSNLVYQKEFLRIAKHVARGETIAQHLEKSPSLFPDMLTQMVAVGERAGNLPEALLYVSELYEREVDDLTKNMSSSIEPILMVCMGILVGFVAISVITPIYGITQTLHP